MIWNCWSNPLVAAKATWQGDIKRHSLGWGALKLLKLMLLLWRLWLGSSQYECGGACKKKKRKKERIIRVSKASFEQSWMWMTFPHRGIIRLCICNVACVSCLHVTVSRFSFWRGVGGWGCSERRHFDKSFLCRLATDWNIKWGIYICLMSNRFM